MCFTVNQWDVTMSNYFLLNEIAPWRIIYEFKSANLNDSILLVLILDYLHLSSKYMYMSSVWFSYRIQFLSSGFKKKIFNANIWSFYDHFFKQLHTNLNVIFSNLKVFDFMRGIFLKYIDTLRYMFLMIFLLRAIFLPKCTVYLLKTFLFDFIHGFYYKNILSFTKSIRLQLC